MLYWFYAGNLCGGQTCSPGSSAYNFIVLIGVYRPETDILGGVKIGDSEPQITPIIPINRPVVVPIWHSGYLNISEACLYCTVAQ